MGEIKMRTVKIEKTLAKFEELNQDQQKIVVEKYRDLVTDFNWFEHDQENFEQALKLLGYYKVQSFFSGFNSQAEGYCFVGEFIMPKNSDGLIERMRNFEIYYPNYLTNDIRDRFIALKFEWPCNFHHQVSLEITTSGFYCNENSMTCEHEEFLEVSRDIARLFHAKLERSYKYYKSYECASRLLKSRSFEYELDTLTKYDGDK
jgi:hypothetical protein